MGVRGGLPVVFRKASGDDGSLRPGTVFRAPIIFDYGRLLHTWEKVGVSAARLVESQDSALNFSLDQVRIGKGAPVGFAFANDVTIDGNRTDATNVYVPRYGDRFVSGDYVCLYDDAGFFKVGKVTGTPTGTTIPVTTIAGAAITDLDVIGGYTSLSGSEYWESDDVDNSVAGQGGLGLNFIDGSIGTGATISLWVRTSSQTKQVLMTVSEHKPDPDYTDTGRWQFFIDTSGFIAWDFEREDTSHSWTSAGTVALDDGLWHHVLVSMQWDGVALGYIYIDGILDSTFNVTVFTTTADDYQLPRFTLDSIGFPVETFPDGYWRTLTVGANEDGSNPLIGDIRNVRLYPIEPNTPASHKQDVYDLAGITQIDVQTFRGESVQIAYLLMDRSDPGAVLAGFSGGDNAPYDLNAVGGASVVQAFTVSKNLWPDPSCESGNVGAWGLVRSGTVLEFYSDTTQQALGTRSLKMETGSSIGSTYVTMTIPVEKGVSYYLSFQFRHTTTDWPGLRIEDTTLGSVLVDDLTIGSGLGSNIWHTYSTVLDIADSGATEHALEVRFLARSGGVDCWLDDFQLFPASSVPGAVAGLDGNPTLIVAGSNRGVVQVGVETQSEASEVHVVDGGTQKPGLCVLYDHAGVPWHLWVDNTGVLRIDSDKPSDEDADGTIVGVQT